jgi:hypothetical protein
MKPSTMLLAGLLVVMSANLALAQNQPFYARGGVYDPVIDVVTSGAQVMVQPVVSHDRKYVTLSIQPQLSQLVNLQTFPVVMVAPGAGFVGGAVPAAAGPGQPADINESRPV